MPPSERYLDDPDFIPRKRTYDDEDYELFNESYEEHIAPLLPSEEDDEE